MSAGLPGLGLGGLFFVISALLAPLLELRRMQRGESTPERRRAVARQFVMALLMIVAVDLSLRGFLALADLAGLIEAAPGGALVIPLAPVGITAALLATLLVTAKAVQLAMAARRALAARRGGRRRLRGRLETDSA